MDPFQDFDDDQPAPELSPNESLWGDVSTEGIY